MSREVQDTVALFEKKQGRKRLFMNVLGLLQGKIVVAVVAGTLLVGGATAAFAATPAGQNVVQSLTHAHATVSVTATQNAHHSGNNEIGTPDQAHNSCPGVADAQNLATHFQLSTSEQGAAVMALCALHEGTFRGMTPTGTAVTSSRVFGYGEIEQLLTYAKFLAAHDTTNVGGTLTDANVSSFLAAALHSCGATPVNVCLKNNIPNFQPGQGDHGGNNNGNGNGNSNGNGNGNGNKPTNTPTPHH